MKRDIDNPELPAETGVTGGASDEHHMTLRTGAYVRGNIGPYRGRYGMTSNATEHVLTLPTHGTRELYVRALLDAARAMGWRGDLPGLIVAEIDKGSAEFHPRRETFEAVRLEGDVLVCRPVRS
jgi:hypothetical protein